MVCWFWFWVDSIVWSSYRFFSDNPNLLCLWLSQRPRLQELVTMVTWFCWGWGNWACCWPGMCGCAWASRLYDILSWMVRSLLRWLSGQGWVQAGRVAAHDCTVRQDWPVQQGVSGTAIRPRAGKHGLEAANNPLQWCGTASRLAAKLGASACRPISSGVLSLVGQSCHPLWASCHSRDRYTQVWWLPGACVLCRPTCFLKRHSASQLWSLGSQSILWA